MNTVQAFLQQNWGRLGLDRYGSPARWEYLILTPRFRASGHVVFIILPQGEAAPMLVAKVPRLVGASTSLQREAANLRAIQDRRSSGVGSIPRLVAFEEFGDRPILVETALSGRPMDPKAVRRDAPGCCKAVLDWLVDLQRPASETGFTSGWFERLVERPLGYFEKVFPFSDQERETMGKTWDIVSPLRQANMPVVFEHGDLSHPNIFLLESGGIGVVDWELAEPLGLPGPDLFFFLTYVAFARRKASSLQEHVSAFHDAFFGKGSWARSYVVEYARQLHLPLAWLTALFVLSWVRYLANLVLRIDHSGRLEPGTAAWLRSNRYYALWQHTLSHINELDWRDSPAGSARSI